MGHWNDAPDDGDPAPACIFSHPYVRQTADHPDSGRYLGAMDTTASRVFLTAALAVMLASGAAASYGAAIYETHTDVYKALTANAQDEQAAKAREARRAAKRKAAAVVLSDTAKGRLTTDAGPAAP